MLKEFKDDMIVVGALIAAGGIGCLFIFTVFSVVSLACVAIGNGPEVCGM